jgi:hypothetical protein
MLLPGFRRDFKNGTLKHDLSVPPTDTRQTLSKFNVSRRPRSFIHTNAYGQGNSYLLSPSKHKQGRSQRNKLVGIYVQYSSTLLQRSTVYILITERTFTGSLLYRT